MLINGPCARWHSVKNPSDFEGRIACDHEVGGTDIRRLSTQVEAARPPALQAHATGALFEFADNAIDKGLIGGNTLKISVAPQ